MTATRSYAKHVFPRGRRIAAAMLVSTLAGTALVACGADAGGAQPAKVSGKGVGETAGGARITWGKCPAPAEGQTRDPRLICGTLEVPLDYRNPGGTKIDVAVSRLSTAKPGTRLETDPPFADVLDRDRDVPGRDRDLCTVR